MTHLGANPLYFSMLLFCLIACSTGSSKDSANNETKQESASTSATKEEEQKQAEEKKAEEKGPVVRVRVSSVARGDIASIIETTSVIEAESVIDVFPKVQGIVAKIFVEEGEQVSIGQPLTKLEDQEARLRAQQAEIAFREGEQRVREAELAYEEAKKAEETSLNGANQAKRDYERNQKLWQERSEGKTSLIALKDLEASKLAWEDAEGAYQQTRFGSLKANVSLESLRIAAQKLQVAWDLAKVELADTELKAKINGIISFRGIKVGDTLTQSTKAFTIVDLDHLLTNFYRPQLELSALKSGLTLTTRSESFPDMVFTGEVIRINPVVDSASGTIKVTAALYNPEHLLRPGMLIRSRVTTDMHKDTVIVPKKAIYYKGEKPTVFAVREGKAVRIALEAGFSDLDRIEVLNVDDNGLRLDDKIVVVGNAELRDGTMVEVVDG